MSTGDAQLWPKPRPAFTTGLAGLLSLLLGILWFALGIAIVVGSAFGIGENELRDVFGELMDALLVAFIFIGIGITVVAFLVILFAIKLIRRRGWARWFQFVLFLIFFLTTLVTFLGGGEVDSSQIDPNYGYAVAIGYVVALGLVTLLLILPPTSRDFRRVREWQYPAPAATPAPTPTASAEIPATLQPQPGESSTEPPPS